jgi:hypothetical protein
MQSADVAAALLNGFGVEDNIVDIDLDDERRRRTLQSTRIGSNRASGRATKDHQAKLRITKQIEKARKRIDERVSLRQENRSTSDPTQYSFEDIKDILSASLMAVRDEHERANRLKKGGGDAARILAEARRTPVLMGLDESEGTEEDPSSDEMSIKPGEVSLVASFSCLHPSVDGVDAILRQGVATAASVLAAQQAIALNSLMSCYYLATLYRDGFRYGNNMWLLEVALDSLVSEARFKATFTPRPRLPRSTLSRPPPSLFHPVSLFSTTSQAVINVVCVGVSVRFAKCLERDAPSPSQNGGRIGLRSNLRHFGRLEQARTALSQLSRVETEAGKFRMFGRPPFQPNYETSLVFMFKVLQTVLTALVDHRGKPFYRSILESRDLCLLCGATLLVFVVCVSGTIMPDFTTKFLQLRPFPSSRSKLSVLGIAGINIAACAVSRWIADRRLTQTCRDGESQRADTPNNITSNAADYEEQLLQEEALINIKNLLIYFGFLSYILWGIVTC